MEFTILLILVISLPVLIGFGITTARDRGVLHGRHVRATEGGDPTVYRLMLRDDPRELADAAREAPANEPEPEPGAAPEPASTPASTPGRT